MCGRYTLVQNNDAKIRERFGVKKVPPELKPRYNIAPSQDVPVILNQHPEDVVMARWGLIPHWSKDEKIGTHMINARAETLLEKPSFKGPVKYKRCLILADSFYEWKTTDGRKAPFRITLKDEEPFAFAGIWDEWQKEGKDLVTCSIITTTANELMAPIHERMPVILPKDFERVWLETKILTEAMRLLRPFDSDLMSAYEVSPLVNSPTHDSPEIIKRRE